MMCVLNWRCAGKLKSGLKVFFARVVLVEHGTQGIGNAAFKGGISNVHAFSREVGFRALIVKIM